METQTVCDGKGRYWNAERETLDDLERAAACLVQMKTQLHRTYAQNPFYQRFWDAEGFHPDQVRTWDDFQKRVPVLKKQALIDDQREHPPFGSYLGVDPSEIARINGSSGTQGDPLLYGVSHDDWNRGGDVFAQALWSMGWRPSDIVQLAFPFNLFFGGWGTLLGVERLGATAFPLGATDSERHVELLHRIKSTVLAGTPSYILRLADVAREMGLDPATSTVKKVLVAGEPGGSVPATKRRLLDAWGATTVCDIGTTSEMFPFCTNVECDEMTGPHVITDEVWTEVVDPADLTVPVHDGERGALIYTHLWRRSQPMIRFAPGDSTIMTHEPCPCGRTYPRLPGGVLGRLDDMLVVRGVNVFPSAIENALREVDGLGDEYRIVVTREHEMDQVSVDVEAVDRQSLNRTAQLSDAASARLKHHCQIRIPVRILAPDELDRSALKTKRIMDLREDGDPSVAPLGPT